MCRYDNCSTLAIYGNLCKETACSYSNISLVYLGLNDIHFHMQLANNHYDFFEGFVLWALCTCTCTFSHHIMQHFAHNVLTNFYGSHIHCTKKMFGQNSNQIKVKAKYDKVEQNMYINCAYINNHRNMNCSLCLNAKSFLLPIVISPTHLTGHTRQLQF